MCLEPKVCLVGVWLGLFPSRCFGLCIISEMAQLAPKAEPGGVYVPVMCVVVKVSFCEDYVDEFGSFDLWECGLVEPNDSVDSFPAAVHGYFVADYCLAVCQPALFTAAPGPFPDDAVQSREPIWGIVVVVNWHGFNPRNFL